MRLPQPTFSTVGAASDKDLQKFQVIVVPAYSSDVGPSLESGDLELLAFSGESFAEILAKWPEYLAKPGEILEIPLTGSGKLVRLLILGLGSGSMEDSRKAGAALGRKVKSSGYAIFSAYVADYDIGVAHITAISLSQYGWS